MTTLPRHFFISDSDFGLYDTRIENWHKLPALRANYRRGYAHIDSVSKFKSTLRCGGYAWPGGYPMYFATSDGSALCFGCAEKEAKQVIWSIRNDCNDGWLVTGCDIDYGECPVSCDHCGEDIGTGTED